MYTELKAYQIIIALLKKIRHKTLRIVGRKPKRPLRTFRGGGPVFSIAIRSWMNEAPAISRWDWPSKSGNRS